MKIRPLLPVSLMLGLLLTLPVARAAEDGAKEPAEQTAARTALEKVYDEAFEAADREVFDAPALRAKLDAFLAQYPQDASAASFVGNYFYYVESIDLGQAKAAWAAFADHANPKVKAVADKKLALAELIQRPIEMKFTAADGRAVDVAALRGKVVLIDFWATWCGPCIQEIPNVVAAYNQYHAQGFEIVGISFDKAPDPAKPNPRHKTAEGVLAFAQEKAMPWPQYYDGLHWNNVFGKQYGIQGIPAMFLLDKRGLVVSTNARGPKLAREIQRLLKE
ncbi:TlpA family protein disulfide reductase [Oleiharenicola lentus]|uniref:TlpA family protein disulfide reductase n=1 Tax=Oleiharenicola lentus TaxID=2508720 RepID=A0A4Q1C8A8_9BACT|nr:TlpA disulfide reductase family protein [Oleiharenicola lentus]RXK55174.1 TlpA family protein disulfide reductase [Oleiharenicola lentus]